MTTISTRNRSQAFTMFELMISVLIFGVVMASLASTFIVFLKSSASVGFYSEMSSQSRRGLEMFARDIRSASGITVLNAKQDGGDVISESGITLSYPSYMGSKSVTYRHRNAADTLRRIVTIDGVTTRDDVLSGMESFKLTFFQTPGDDFTAESGPLASVDDWTKSVQMDAELVRNVISIRNSDYIISARFMLRNY